MNTRRWWMRILARPRSAAIFGALVALLPVRPADAQVSATKILERVSADARRSIDFHAAAFPDSVYVGQQVTYQVAVFLSADARSRLRRNPEFLPPELRGLLAYELGTPTRVPPQVQNGAVYEVHIFQRALFPVAPGTVTVPAPQLTYSMPSSSSYFSREEKSSLDGETVPIHAIPIPTIGRPAEFTGAVGVFTAVTRLDTATARVGDPLVMTLQVQGIGNVKLLPRPSLEIEWATAVPGTERVRVDTAGSLVRGTKEFDWILTPTREGRVSVPVVHYGYFDPYRSKFMNADAPALEIEVRAGSLVVAEDADGSVVLPLRGDHGNAAQTRNSWRWLDTLGASGITFAIVLALMAPIPALVLILSARRRNRPVPAAQPIAPTATLARWTGLSPGTLPDANVNNARAVRRTLHTALGDRLQVPAALLVTQRQLVRALRRRGVTRDTTTRVVSLLDTLDATSFANVHPALTSDAVAADNAPATDWSREAGTLYARVDAEAMHGGAPLPTDRWAVRALIVFVAIGAAVAPLSNASALTRRDLSDSVIVQRPSIVAEVRTRAAAAYGRHAFVEASALFAGLVRGAPRDPDLLYDWGTAAWAAGDTVHAVIAWQRAARLDPLDAGLQDRLSLLPSGARGGLADVPLIPVVPLAALAVALWVFGWLFVAAFLRVSQSNRSSHPLSWWHRALRPTGSVAIVCGVACGGLSWWGNSLLDPTGLAVVTRPETLHVAPGADADAMGGVATGDVVRSLESREGWQRVRHADGRVGWLPETRTVTLLDDAPSR